jgi:hypothetical protein
MENREGSKDRICEILKGIKPLDIQRIEAKAAILLGSANWVCRQETIAVANTQHHSHINKAEGFSDATY